MRLSGWQRIGWVVLAIWLVLGYLMIWQDRRETAFYRYAAQSFRCMTDYTFPPTIDHKKFEECKAQAQTNFEQEIQTFSNEVRITKSDAALLVVPPFIVWGLVSFIIVTVRWVRRGLAPRR